MIRRLAAALLLLVAAAAVAQARPAAAAPGDISGLWRNPDGSVLVRIQPCGSNICGVVVGATPTAQADARDGGYAQLIGLPILLGYHPAGPRHWEGRVLVPDLGHVFSSHIDLVDSGHARIAGCLFHQHLCQTQLWQRA